MKILGISGHKQAGKDTLGSFISGVKLKEHGAIEDFRMTDNGELEIFTKYQDGSKDWGILDVTRKDREFEVAAEVTIWPYVKIYGFADPLKRLAIDLFGLSFESVYGTDEQKNAPTHLLWENMPGNVKASFNVTYTDVKSIPWCCLEIDKYGPMSGREFLQYLGTEIGRKIYAPIWINATMHRIISEGSELAIITDVRFPDEIEAIHKAGGLTSRLTRKIFEDSHYSENALNDYKGYSFIIGNHEMTIKESCEAMYRELRGYNYV